MSASLSFESLPDELIAMEIVPWLDAPGRAALACTSRRYQHNVITETRLEVLRGINRMVLSLLEILGRLDADLVATAQQGWNKAKKVVREGRNLCDISHGLSMLRSSIIKFSHDWMIARLVELNNLGQGWNWEDIERKQLQQELHPIVTTPLLDLDRTQGATSRGLSVFLGMTQYKFLSFREDTGYSPIEMVVGGGNVELGVAMLGDLVQCQRLYPFLDSTIYRLVRACGGEHSLYHQMRLGDQSSFQVMDIILLIEKEYRDDERNAILYWVGQHLLASITLSTSTQLLNVTNRMSGPMRDRLLFHGAQSAVRRGEFEIGVQLMRDVQDEAMNTDWRWLNSDAGADIITWGQWFQKDCLYYGCLVAIEELNGSMYEGQLFLKTLKEKVSTIIANRFRYTFCGIESRKRWRELGDAWTKMNNAGLRFKRLEKSNLTFYKACYEIIRDGFLNSPLRGSS